MSTDRMIRLPCTADQAEVLRARRRQVARLAGRLVRIGPCREDVAAAPGSPARYEAEVQALAALAASDLMTDDQGQRAVEEVFGPH